MAANVLIVDDSVTMRRMIKRTIEISGLDVAEVYEASNGIEALARMDQYSIWSCWTQYAGDDRGAVD